MLVSRQIGAISLRHVWGLFSDATGILHHMQDFKSFLFEGNRYLENYLILQIFQIRNVSLKVNSTLNQLRCLIIIEAIILHCCSFSFHRLFIYISAIIENLIDCQSTVRDIAGVSGLLVWLLRKLRAKVVFEPNKLYASEILAICVQVRTLWEMDELIEFLPFWWSRDSYIFQILFELIIH